MTLTSLDYKVLTPYIILTVWACVLLLVDLFIPKDRKGMTALLSALGLAITLGFTLSQIGSEASGCGEAARTYATQHAFEATAVRLADLLVSL